MITNQLREDLKYTRSNLSDGEWDKLKESTILITGCAGFIGFYFCHFLFFNLDELRLKKVICLDNFMLGRPRWLDEMAKDKRFVVEKFDIIEDDIGSVPESGDADYIIHMASIASPMFYRMHPIETIDANIWGLRRLFEFYKEKEIKGFLFFTIINTNFIH